MTNDTAPSSTLTLDDSATLRKVILTVFWPLSVGLMLYKVFIQAVNGHITNDFLPVYAALTKFVHGQPVYTDNYAFTNPHYLYAPSGSLLLSPFAMMGSFTLGRWAFIGFNAVCIVLATVVLLKIFDLRWTSPLFPVLLFLSFLTEGVTNTLVFSNINGFIYLCEVGFLALLLRNQNWWAGVPLGFSLAIKPMLAPLLLIPLLLRRVQPFVAAVGIPVVLNLIAWPLSVDPLSYFQRTTPYLGEVRDYYNNALAGWLAYWGTPDALIWAVRIGFLLLGLAAIVALQPYRTVDLRLWMLTLSGVVLLIAFLCGSLGQRYYSIMLIPLVTTIVLRTNFLRVWPAWVAVYLILDGSRWYSSRWYIYGRWLEYSRATAGWSLLLLTLFLVVLWQTLVAYRENNPDFPRGWRAYL